ncbi:FxsA family protein [Desulfonatronospira sp. MSAO_Bac3]|uniref:FxsA family protein n=1 Tax=Desulfonatronospira sp. MSAO_Bac3 TaxID=2293857 RepID=UPI000FF6D912|nr:FxsA family protein [Desulfonatronospira sp. MSAO_Bac3]RQD78707.1 MAG: FxsA family protein [Desulfonatronospira sp. MSAO_Bac3]
MFLKIFAAFVILPIVEIYVLIKIGSHIGALWTVLLVIATAFVGAFLAKMQGAYTMFRLRTNLQQGIPPTHDILDAFLIFAAGLVFLTPGFITDLMGLLVLIPQTRKIIRSWLVKKIDLWMRQGNVHVIRRW